MRARIGRSFGNAEMVLPLAGKRFGDRAYQRGQKFKLL